jgi:hypothetical protein
MATQSVSYLSGEDPGTAKANAEYQDALQKMLAALDSRKNRMFDPQLLALAEGFLTPTKTGSFGESLGYAAGNLRKAEEQQAEQDQKLAEARLGLAGKGLELERQRARERGFQQLIGGEGTTPASEPTKSAADTLDATRFAQAPVGAATPAAGAAQPLGATAGAAPAGVAGVQGVPFMPPDPSIITNERDFYRLAAQDPNMQPATARLKWQEMQAKRYVQLGDTGTVDRATGMLYPRAGGATVERRIFGKNYPVSPVDAAHLDMAQRQGPDAHRAMQERVLQGLGGAAAQSLTEAEVEKAGSLEREKVLQTDAAKKEASSSDRYMTSLEIKSAAERMAKDVAGHQAAFGLLANRGIASAIGTFIDEGVQVGNWRAQLPGFAAAIKRVAPGITDDDLKALERYAGNRAQIELYLRRIYFGGQGMGSVSDMETAIIPRVIGSEKETPESILDKLQLLTLRSEHEMKEVQLWNQMSKANPRLTYYQFQKSDQYTDLKRKYEAALKEAFLTDRPSPPAGSATSAPSGAQGAAPARPAAAGAAPARPAAAGSASTAPARPSTGTPAATPRPSGAATPQGSGASPMYPGATNRLDGMGLGIGSGR